MNRRIRVCVGRATTLMVVLSLGLAGAFATPAGASDKSAAKKLVLTEADVGSDYTLETAGGPNLAGGGPDPSAVFVNQCVGKPIHDSVSTAQFTGPVFIGGQPDSGVNAAHILSSVSIVKTKAMAAAAVAVYSDPKFGNCFARLVTASPGITSVTAKTVPVKSYGSFRTAVQVSYIRQSSFGPTPSTIVSVWIQRGRALINVLFITDGHSPQGGFGPTQTSVAAFDQTQMDAMLDKLKPRLKRAPK